MTRRAGGHSVPPMTRSDRHGHAPGEHAIAPSTVVWNAVVPVLGIALIAGAPLLAAFALAAVATIAIYGVLAPESLRDQWRRWTPARVAPQRVRRGN
jgi:uncharacterized membrane protein